MTPYIITILDNIKLGLFAMWAISLLAAALVAIPVTFDGKKNLLRFVIGFFAISLIFLLAFIFVPNSEQAMMLCNCNDLIADGWR